MIACRLILYEGSYNQLQMQVLLDFFDLKTVKTLRRLRWSRTKCPNGLIGPISLNPNRLIGPNRTTGHLAIMTVRPQDHYDGCGQDVLASYWSYRS